MMQPNHSGEATEWSSGGFLQNTQPNQNSAEAMEWSSGVIMQNGSQFEKVNQIIHSTPLQFRPLPTASPNVSPIEKGHHDVAEVVIERTIIEHGTDQID